MDLPENETPDPPARPSSRLPLLVGVVLLVALLGGYLALGSPGLDRSDDATTGDGGEADHASARLDVEEFENRMQAGDAVVINVHIPYEGEIDGTDLFLPFDTIGDDPRLPDDQDTEILLYCMSGRMSLEAADTLAAAGYTDVVDLEGGMEAWQAAGRSITVSETDHIQPD